jgi:hypothetical protein
MSKERYNQIVDEVFKKYADSHWTLPENPNGPLLSDQLWSLKPMQHSKETFINECKTDKEFSEKWGLKIEERDLYLAEMIRLAKYENEEEIIKTRKENINQISERLLKDNIPTRAISLIYKGEKLEIYE